jgi:hypothetical protein
VLICLVSVVSALFVSFIFAMISLRLLTSRSIRLPSRAMIGDAHNSTSAKYVFVCWIIFFHHVLSRMNSMIFLGYQ